MSETKFKTREPASGTHHAILMDIRKKADVVNLIESDVPFSSWHWSSILRNSRTLLC